MTGAVKALAILALIGGQLVPASGAWAEDDQSKMEPVAELGSPQRAKTGSGISAGKAAGQTRRGGNRFFNTTTAFLVLSLGATAAIAIVAASDNDTISSTTSTN